MNLPGVARSAMIFGGAVIGGAVVGAGAGAVRALKSEGVDNAFSRQEGRDTLANVIIGAGAGALAGVALLGARKVIPAMGALPVIGQVGTVGAVSLGLGVGAAGYGAYTVAGHMLD